MLYFPAALFPVDSDQKNKKVDFPEEAGIEKSRKRIQ
jgi:hypothetical protein